ncbi:MAG: energy transducer TonB [Dysgonomonas sp.]|nr:energy transducer TonB [Dysgonomonas sp.]
MNNKILMLSLLFIYTFNIEAQTVEVISTEIDTANHVVINGEVDLESFIYYIEEDGIPRFPGGDTYLYEYISKQMKYPYIARMLRVEGTVVLGFTVDRAGCISDVKVLKSLHPICDKEAMKVVKAMPKWVPYRAISRRRYTNFTIPITFKLKRDKPEKY